MPGINEKVFDKHGAAEYLGTTEANVFYHHYVSKNLKGGSIRFGRVMWSRNDLDTFKANNPTPGYKEQPGVRSITVSQFQKDPQYKAMQKAGTMAFMIDGYLVKSVEPSQTARMYVVTVYDQTDGKDYMYEVWNNTRVILSPIQDSE